MRNKHKIRTRVVQVTPEETSSLKSVLGGALWLAKETRPDLAVQVSQGQQLMPHPTVGQARQIGNVVRRAKQYRDQKWVILPIPLDKLRLCLHTDAAFANAKKQGTQAGYLVGITDDRLAKGLEAPRAPAIWKSYRLKRVVGSTFAGESQVLMDGLGHVEWLGCHLAEVKFKQFSLERRSEFLQQFNIQAVVDCKSIYDFVQSFSCPASVSDKRVAIDLVIIKETLRRIGAVVRWCPTQLQLADALTKENAEAMDMLRAAINSCKYHLNNESQMMEEAAKQRQVRLERRNTTAPKEVASSVVLCLRCTGPMVKLSTSMFNETEIRGLFEAVANENSNSETEFTNVLMQNSSSCSLKVAGSFVNEKKLKGVDAKITYTDITRPLE